VKHHPGMGQREGNRIEERSGQDFKKLTEEKVVV
jgi:hypothetical protein